MGPRKTETTRIVSVIAATVIALACGTNYVYSAWAPQFASKLALSSTEINLMGTAGNLGMYGSGILVGMLVDAKGPRPAVLLGALSLGIGYFPIYRAYTSDSAAKSVPVLCIFSALTGLGSSSAFSAAIKTSALNWPEHRGTATAFPLAAFGLSAFFFSTLSSIAFPDKTSDFLLVLAVVPFTLVLVCFFFLKVVPHALPYSLLPTTDCESRVDARPIQRTKSQEGRRARHHLPEHGRRTDSRIKYPEDESESSLETAMEAPKPGIHESRSLVSRPSVSYDYENTGRVEGAFEAHNRHVDIRGLALLPKLEFWQTFALLGILTGIGLMTINNIGNDARTQALWSHYDDSVAPEFIQKRQAVHVSIISLMSFGGRLTSGVGSDLIKKRFRMSRFWCLVLASLAFAVAQICAMRIENPHHLWAVSAFNGLGYGVTFGVYPALTAEIFGVHGLSQNWGSLCLAAVFSGNVFNLIYGTVYDHHSTILPTGERDCSEGLYCYRAAYWVTLAASLVALGISLWGMHTEHVRVREAADAAAVVGDGGGRSGRGRGRERGRLSSGGARERDLEREA